MPNEQKNKANNKDSQRQDRYETEVEGVSMKTLKAGLWWTKNRLNLRRILIIILIVFSVISLGYSLFGFGSYLLVGMNKDYQMVKDLVQNKIAGQDYLLQAMAKGLTYSSAGIISNDGKYDLYIQVKNPNVKYWGVFSYCFITAAKEKSCGSDFILPEEKKYILSLAKTFKNRSSSAVFSITKMTWYKIDNHTIFDWNKYLNDHLNISIKNKAFIPAASNEVSEKISLNTLNFTALNNGAFGYWEAPFTIILSDNGKIVSVNRYIINNFISHDSREIKITWPGIIGPVSDISITPDINIMGKGVYQQPNE